MRFISALGFTALLALALGCNGGCATTATTKLDERPFEKMVILKDDQKCQFVVTDPSGEMFLTVITPDENIQEFSPKVHTMVIFSDQGAETNGLRSIAFAATAKVDVAEQELTITIVNHYQINQLMFQLLVEKYNTIHIDEHDLQTAPETSPETEEENIKPSGNIA